MDIEINDLTSLVEAVKNGEDGAFEKLYHKSFKHAYSTASLLLKNEQDIEDVLQTSYMYVSLYIKNLKKPESFNNWLSVIVKHECQKHIAKQKRVSDIFFTVKKNKEFDMEEENLLPSDYFEKKESLDAVQKIIDDLPDDKRACIFLFYYEQNSLAEIAEILGVPEGTVMSRLYYARKKLEKEFKKLQKKDEALYGISVIPFIVSFIAVKAKALTVPASAESAIIAAVTSSSSAATATAVSAAAAGTSAAGATGAGTAAAGTAVAGTSAVTSAAGTAGAAVATKVAAVAVAAAVATGGGVAMAKHIKSDNQAVTTQISSVATTEGHATVADAFYAAVTFEETTLSETQSSESAFSSKLSTEKVISSAPAVSASSTSKPAAAKKTTSAPTKVQKTTSKPSTTSAPTTVQKTTSRPSTTSAPTTAKPTTTTKPATTVKQTTEKPTAAKTDPTEQTSSAADNFKISNGVLNEYTGNESSVQIPSTVTAIGTGAFSGNTSITSVSIPSGVTRIGLEAFSDCTNLRSVSLPSSLQSIGVAAFYGCSSLTSVTIPEGTQTISDEAFSNCSSLSSVTIPDSVTSISEDAFYGSDNVTIKCSEGSAAHDYAVANSMKFELI